jgi:signal transduction histidine kinase
MPDQAGARERLYRQFVAEEVASAQRHRLVNRIAGAGALAFHLKRQLPPGDPGAPAAAVIPLLDAELGQAAALLDLHFLPPPAHPAPPVPLGAAVASAVRWLRALGTPGRVEVVGPAADATAALVLIDPRELELAAFCLLENACEALEGRPGTVRIAWARPPAPPGAGEPPQVVLEIRDDGVGLAGQAAEQAREPFFSTRAGHLGVGINVAIRVARRCGGRLELAPAPPAGAVARLFLPAGAP